MFRALSRDLRQSPGSYAAYLFLLLLLVCIAAGGLISPFKANEPVGEILSAPGGAHPLGTDSLGRDVLSYLIAGAATSLGVAVAVAICNLMLGLILGSVAGFFRGPIDAVISRVMEFFQIVPAFVVALVVVAVLGNEWRNIIIALVIGMWVRMGRLVRSQYLTYRERDFVASLQSQGFRAPTIMAVDILPAALVPILVQFALDVGLALLFFSGLTFLGLGDPDVPSWGLMLNYGQSQLLRAPWISAFAGAAIVATVIAFNLVADHISAKLDRREVLV